MASYETKNVLQNQLPAGVFHFALGENNRRVALHISSFDAVGTASAYSISPIGDFSDYWMVGPVPGRLSLPYRDFGPVIRRAVWINPLQATQIIVISEVWLMAD